MVKSYRGKEWDMVGLARKYEQNIALGHTEGGYVQNGRGDLIKNGKVVKTREEQIKEWKEKFQIQQAETKTVSKDNTNYAQPITNSNQFKVEVSATSKPVFEKTEKKEVKKVKKEKEAPEVVYDEIPVEETKQESIETHKEEKEVSND